MSGLPEGWAEATLGEVILPFETTDPTRRPDVEFQYIDIGSIDNQTQTVSDPKSILGRDAPSRARRVVRTGDVLFSTVRTYLKNIAVVPESLDGQLTSTGIAVLRSSTAVDGRYLFNWVKSDEFISTMSKAQDGTLYPAVTDKDVSGGRIPLPPIPEQKRIVAKVDGLTARTARARTDLARIPTLIARYKQRLITIALSGDLTKEWRSRNGFAESKTKTASIETPTRYEVSGRSIWDFGTIGGVCRIEGGSQPPKSTFIYDPRPNYVRLIQIRDYKSDKNIVYIPRELARRFVSKTDIMIGRYGPPIFQILRGLEGAYNVALMKAVPDEKKISHDFLYWFLKSPILLSYVEMDSKRTAGQDGVNRDQRLIPFSPVGLHVDAAQNLAPVA
jgi:type I restriction enzyme S subunit